MSPATEVLMYDSVTLSNIPAGAVAVAGYVDGRYANWEAVLQRWPRARHASITVTGRVEADVVDVEQGDVSPQGAMQWLARMHALGHAAPALYVSLEPLVTQLQPLLVRQYERRQYRLWVAHYTGQPHRCSAKCDRRLALPVDATQFTNAALGRDLDCSVALTTFFTRHTPGGSPAGR
jgi:hypothetical protein